MTDRSKEPSNIELLRLSESSCETLTNEIRGLAMADPSNPIIKGLLRLVAAIAAQGIVLARMVKDVTPDDEPSDNVTPIKP